jgi:tetratricopeptide (TPR) repeat protein
LFKVASGQVEDTFKLDKALTDFFSVQDAVAEDLGNSLLERFTITPAPALKKRGTSNEQAYRNYLQGMYLYDKRSSANSEKAIALFEQAVQLDPNYAAAWAGKAHAHRYAANLSREIDTHREYRKSIEAINIALSLDKDLSEAHSALCENRYYYEFDFENAEVECKLAINLDPNSSLAREIYGRFLYQRGRFDESIAEIKAAIDLDPGSLFNQRNLGIAYYYAGHYQDAEVQLKRVIGMDQGFGSAYMWLRYALEMQEKYAEAFEWFIKGQEAIRTDAKTVDLYRSAYATSGYTGLMRAHANFADSYNQYYIGAILNAQVGNKDRAFEYLERSYQRREWGMNSLMIEPQLVPLRAHPRFQALVKKVGLN